MIGSSYVMSPDHLDARVWCCQAREDISQKYMKAIAELTPVQISAKRNLTSILNYFQSRHMHTEERWHRFIEWNTILDKSRNESYKNYDFFNKYIMTKLQMYYNIVKMNIRIYYGTRES